MQGLLQMQQREGLPSKEACRAVCRWFIDAHSDIWGWAQPYSDANSVCTGVGNSLDHQTLFRKCQQPSPCRRTAASVFLTRIANWQIWSRFELLFCCLASSPTWFVAIVQWRTQYFLLRGVVTMMTKKNEPLDLCCCSWLVWGVGREDKKLAGKGQLTLY